MLTPSSATVDELSATIPPPYSAATAVICDPAREILEEKSAEAPPPSWALHCTNAQPEKEEEALKTAATAPPLPANEEALRKVPAAKR